MSEMNTRRGLGAIVCAAFLVACSSSAPAPRAAVASDGGTPAATAVTFHKDVEPITQKSCQPCHVIGGIAPFPLVTYADTKPYADRMVAQTGAGTMPPWGAVETADCTPRYGWKEDVRLTSSAIDTIRAWRDQGALEGSPADAPAPVVPQAPGLAGAQLQIAPPAPYSILVGGPDQFRCFVLDPQLTTTSYINGTFIIPGNSTIVHHALVFADAQGQSKKLITDPATASYDCFGGPGFSSTSLVTAWAPGGVPVQYPDDVGMQIDPGTLLVMQVHYHPHSVTATQAPDQTTFQARFASSTPGHLAAAVLLGNFDSPVATTGGLAGTGLLPGPDDPPTGPVFDIPPNVTGHTETMQVTIPASSTPPGNVSFRIVGIGGHEHYVGSAVDITVARKDPTTGPANECLLSIPGWNFDWQRVYEYDAPLDQLPVVSTGDVVQIKCTYDNTLANAKVATSLQSQGLSQPQDVRLGETTLDEMCLGAFLVIR